MKQKMVKRVMALMLSAALVLPGVPVETFAAGTSAQADSVSDEVEFVITNPADSVNAYAGQPLVFYVRANEAESYAVTDLESLGTGNSAASFDAKTGKFKWTPADENVGRNYKITFTASRGTGDTVKTTSKEVTIQVGSAGDIYKTAVLPVSEDAFVQQYGSGKNFGLLPVLILNKNSATGLMGEGLDTADDFISLLKFDMSSGFKDSETGADVTVDLSKIVNASLSLTYVTCKNSGDSSAADQMRIAVLPNNEWQEGTGSETDSTDWITANGLKTMLQSVTYTEDNTVLSAEYLLGNENGEWASSWGAFKDNWKGWGKSLRISGRQIVTDITKFVTEKAAETSGDNKLSLLLNETGNKQHYFVSREGAGLRDEFNSSDRYGAPFDAVENIKNAAPSLIVTYVAEEQQFGIEGNDMMVLPEDYAATGSDSFAVLGAEQAGETGSLELSGNTAGGKIKFNQQEQCLEIPEGLTTGAYEMSIKATDDAQTDTHDFTLYVKSNTTLPTFTGPRKEIQAFVGRELTFYAKADNSEDFGDKVILGVDEEDMEAMDGAVFDPQTGKFSWTPTDDNGDETYEVTFYAYDHSKIPVKHTVTIKVDASATMGATDTVIPVSADATIHSWNGTKPERDQNHGDKNYLRTNISESGSGYLGEGVAGEENDAKLTFLKFDLSQFADKMDQTNGANLVLTYLGAGTNNYQNPLSYADGVAGIRVTALPIGTDNDFKWSETAESATDEAPALTWNTWKAWRGGDSSEGTSADFEVGENDYKASKIHRIKNGTVVYPNSIDNGFDKIVGTKIKVDITKYIQDALKAYRDSVAAHTQNSESPVYNELTLIMNNNSNDKLFVSKEGAAQFTNKTALNGEEITAPSIVITEPYETEIVDGPTDLELVEGYQDTVSNSFAVHGNANEVTVIERNSGGKITWDSDKRQVQVGTGLKMGNYPVILKVGDKTRRFEVRVLANDLQPMQAILDKTIQEQGRYTDAGWAKYRYAVIAVETAIQSGTVTGEGLVKGRSMIQSARRDLQTLESALDEQIEKYNTMIANGKGLYTDATLEALKEEVKKAEKLLESEFTEAQMDSAVSAMKDAEESLAYSSAKSELKNLFDQLSDKYKDEDSSKYTEASWQEFQTGLDSVKSVVEDTEATEQEIAAAKETLNGAETKLETLNDALARLIQTKTDGVTGAQGDYTEDSWEVYQTALETVEGLSGSTYTERRMNQLLSLLDTAIKNLKLREEQIPCTCEISFTGLEGFTMAAGSTKTLAPRVVIDDSNCHAQDGKHITEANVAFAYRVADAVSAGAPSAISVTENGVVTAAGEGNATILVTVTVTRPGSGSASTTVSVPVTVNETGVAEKVNVTFNSNGGTNVAAQEIDQNTAVSEPAAPTKDGYTFTGWYKDEELKEKYDFSQPVTKDITLYAGWNKTAQKPEDEKDKDDKTVAVGSDTTIGATVYTLGANNTVIIKKGEDTATVNIPATVKVNNVDCKVVGIGKDAFANCKKVKKVVIGNNVTSIGDQAFANCTSLTNVTIGTGVTTIGKKAFFKDKKLKTVKITGTAIKSIKGQAFKGTKSNIKVKLPKKMKAAQKKKIKKLLKKAKISSKAVVK